MLSFLNDIDSDNCSDNKPLFSLFSFENEENECFPYKEDDNINNLNNEIIIDRIVSKDPINNTLNLEKTNYETNKKLIFNYPLKALPKIGNFTHFYSLNLIQGILVNIIDDNDKENDIISKIIKNKLVIEAEEYLKSGKKININNIKDYIDEYNNFFDKGNIIYSEGEEVEIIENNLSQKKRGRPTKESRGEEHNRYSGDNIIKKIKAKLFNFCYIFINSMINNNEDKEIKILKIEYKNIDKLKKEYNLDLLKRPLKYLFSLNVSDKYKTKSQNKDHNDKLIKDIIDEKKYIEIEDYNTIKFLLDISLSDWIDLFTYKKDIYTLAKEYDVLDINYDKIQHNFIGASHLLKKISKENKTYFSLFVLYLFNFQRWFDIKKGRNVQKKED